MTMLAIFRVSNGLNGLGDLDVVRRPDRGVPEFGENCFSHQRWPCSQGHKHTPGLDVPMLLLK